VFVMCAVCVCAHTLCVKRLFPFLRKIVSVYFYLVENCAACVCVCLSSYTVKSVCACVHVEVCACA